MATSDKPKPASSVPADLLPLIRRSRVMTDRNFDDLRGRVLRGEYPQESLALADHLVREKILTRYQAQRLLSNKSHGLSVGRYSILDRLGAGSMGRVYKAQHMLMGRVVALKIISPEIVTNERVVARFQREMKLVGRLDHPNVVRAYDADQIDSMLFIVMEYVPGESLAQVLRARGRLSPSDVVLYGMQAAMGLAHAHAQGIVHRDIKPSNLLLGETRQVKILDLGLGVLTDQESQGTFMTAEGIAVGTIDYMSPEQACGKELDGRSDLYSLGCTMYHLMAGQTPFPGESQIERLGKRINSSPVPIGDLLPGLPSRLVKAMDRLLANDPKDRFQSASEVVEALKALARKKSPPPRPEPAPVQAQAPTPPPMPVVSHVDDVLIPPPPEFPAWFRPVASLVRRSPLAGLLALLGTLASVFGLGLLAGWLLL